MPGQARGSNRGRGASRGGRGGGRGGRGRSSSRGGGVGRQNAVSVPPRGRIAKKGRGRVGRGSNQEGTCRRKSGSLHSSTGLEKKETLTKQPENDSMKVVVKEEASQTQDRQLPVRKSKKSPKKKSDSKVSPQCEEAPSGEKVENLITEVKMPELRKPEAKPVVKDVKKKTAKKSLSDPVKDQLQSEDDTLKTKLSQEVSTASVTESKMNISENTSPAMNTSNSTGLKVFSITSSIPGYVFTTNDRAKLVRSIPGVVVINTAGKGDQLIVGVDMEDDQLSRLLPKMEMKCWNVSCLDTTDKDTFSYFAGWKLIPRVDKSGMFQLIVNLRTQGWRSKDAEMRRRNQLLSLVKDFNITKIVHGEGETILLVSHALECVAYSDLLRKEFTLEKRHTWQPKPILIFKPEVHHPGQERHFWVKVKDSELNNLTTAHKQYTVFHQLSSAGKVLQLEHRLFGAEDNYLVVYSDLGDTKMPVLGQQFCLLELLPDALPDFYTPSYGVDAWGFYSVSGKFPEDVSDETRNRFAEDMKKVGAVGFRSGEVEDTFSLHFVNSRCLEQISHCAQFSSFRLTILSSLVRKTSFEKKLKKMVPSILKYKELKMAKNDVVKQPKQESDSGSAKEEEGSNVIGKKIDEESKPESVKVETVKEDMSVAKEIKYSKKIKGMREKVEPMKEAETCVKNEGYGVTEVHKKNEAMMEMAKEALKNRMKTADESFVKLTETELLRICWRSEGSLHKYLVSLCKFLDSITKIVVTEEGNSEEVVFSFLETKVVEVLDQKSSDATNTFEKIKAAPQKVQIQASKFYKNKFGLVVGKNSSISQLKKDFSKFDVEIEVRSQVIVLWCQSKLSFYKALTDPGTLGYKMIPCVQNFQFDTTKKTVSNSISKSKKVATKNNKIGVQVVASEVESVPSTSIQLIHKKVDDEKVVAVVNSAEVKPEVKGRIQLTEREVFGFIWQKTTGRGNLRDDQVISRQLTNFIKTVSCEDISTDEDGLVVTFSTEAEKTEALTKFCPAPVPGLEELAALSRKFTLLPSRGFFGLFSVQRVKPEHFSRFGDCKIRNCGIWFSDKLAMFNVLRDPFISKSYPTL